MKNKKIAIIGLGYVGLPLAVEFGKKRETIGYDINKQRIIELNNRIDTTLEISKKELEDAFKLSFTDELNQIRESKIFIVTVPTPIDNQKNPDLQPLKDASKKISPTLKNGDIAIYESTANPGATEEVCVPILENYSGLIFNKDFYCGYSPERINPGDKEHRVTSIKKVTSGSTTSIADEVDKLYQEIIDAGTHKASSIKVAEAAKVIENTQRDINIALINEFALIFDKLNIDTESVLEAAGTKWNFLNFRPGLVGGHCIGVDPYYLTFKSLEAGYNPEMILAGRKLNDQMGFHVASQVYKLMINKNINTRESNILIMGLTFKENCPDIRNTLVAKLFEEFKKLECNIDVYDPWANKTEALNIYNILLVNEPFPNKYDAIVLAVAHDEFKQLSLEELKSFGKENHVIYDLKYLFKENEVDGRL